MKRTSTCMILVVLSLSACEMPEQRGLFGQDSPEEIAKKKAEAAEAEAAASEEEEFKIMEQYSEEDLATAKEFVIIRDAIASVEKALEAHPKQGIKTGFLYGGISLLTTKNCAYWYKDGKLYSVNPFARAFSAHLPEAPGEISEKSVQETAALGTDLEKGRGLASPVEQQFGEFIGLIDYINASLLEKDESAVQYTVDFLEDLTVPISKAQELDIISDFKGLFVTIEAEQGEAYEELNIAQSLTIYSFGRAREEMSPAEVAQILGNEGDQIEETLKGGDKVSLYAWRNDGESNMYVFFRNGELFDKVIVGIN